MISASKSDYRMSHPNHVVVFNANIFTRKGEKIWYGDLDLTVDGDALKAMAVERGADLYVFRERDGRFDHETSPVWEAAVAHVTADELMISNP
jgi:hypothetical protein